jgi:hypothetical protein
LNNTQYWLAGRPVIVIITVIGWPLSLDIIIAVGSVITYIINCWRLPVGCHVTGHYWLAGWLAGSLLVIITITDSRHAKAVAASRLVNTGHYWLVSPSLPGRNMLAAITRSLAASTSVGWSISLLEPLNITLLIITTDTLLAVDYY